MIPSGFRDVSQIPGSLGVCEIQIMMQFSAFAGHTMVVRFSASGGLLPWPSDPAPGPCWGALPPYPGYNVVRHARHVSSWIWRCPCTDATGRHCLVSVFLSTLASALLCFTYTVDSFLCMCAVAYVDCCWIHQPVFSNACSPSCWMFLCYGCEVVLQCMQSLSCVSTWDFVQLLQLMPITC